MAKWGEGDPRWLVESREDGKNVNAWHWSEKSKLSWCRDRLGQLLPNVTTSSSDAAAASCTITGVKAVTGEASISTRKGNKKLALFDLTVTCSWEGQLEGNEKKVQGEWKIEDFCSGSEADDYICTVSAEGSGAEQDELKKIAEKLKPALLSQLQQFIVDINALEQ